MMRVIMGFIFVSIVVGGCTRPKDLEFIDVQNIRMIQLGLTESEVGVDVRFYNPNKQRVQLKDANAKVYANSTYLGETHMDSTVWIPRKDTFSIPLTMKIPTLTVLSKVMQSLSDSTVNIKVDGIVKMGKAGVFINYPIHYERQQKMSDLNF